MRGGLRRAAPVAIAGAALLLPACDDDPPPPITEEALRRATYLSDATEDGTITLEGGVYRAGADPGTAGELRVRFVDHAVGDLDGDGREDAAVVLLEEAGNDRMLRLHALLAEGDSLRDVASRLLGDRIRVRGVRIVDDLIATDLVIRGPGEPGSAPPTVPATLGFALTDRGLLPLDPPGVAADRGLDSGDPVASLAAGDWTLSGLDSEEGQGLLDRVPRAPRFRFTPELVEQGGVRGRLSGFAGCNRVFASYRATADGGLRVSALARTRRSCEGREAELERLVTVILETASRFALEGGQLLVHGSVGSLRLAPVAGPPERPLESAPDGAAPLGRPTATG